MLTFILSSNDQTEARAQATPAVTCNENLICSAQTIGCLSSGHLSPLISDVPRPNPEKADLHPLSSLSAPIE